MAKSKKAKTPETPVQEPEAGTAQLDGRDVIESLAGDRDGDGGGNAEEDAWLAKHDEGDDEIAEEVVLARLKEVDGEVPAEPEPEAEGEKTKEEQDTPDPKAGASATKLAKARHALKRIKVPQEVLDELPEAQVLEWGLALAKDQAETDRIIALKSKSEAGETSQGANEAAAGKAEPAAAPPLDALKELVRPLADEWGQEAADAFGGVLVKAVGPLHEQINTLVNVLAQRETEEAKAELRERFPQLDDPETFEAVLAKSGTLLKTGDFTSMKDVLLAAIRWLDLEDHSQAKAREQQQAAHRKRANGKPVTQSRQMPTKALSKEERESFVLDLLEKGRRDEAYRVGRGE